MYRLDANQRAFLVGLSRVGFANPFSEDRERLDSEFCGLPTGTPRPKVLACLLQRVSAFLAQLDTNGLVDPAHCRAEDREALMFLCLFERFHHHIDDFDALIPRQIEGGDRSLVVPFGPMLMEALMAFGFSESEAARGVALCWQARRAYYFMERKLTGSSPCMRALRERLWTNVFTATPQAYLSALCERMEDFSTLLLGETGSGKGMAAYALGCSGFIPYDPGSRTFNASFTQAFVSLNLSQYPEALIESELFGHRKGAFTGAVEAHEGVFARCSPHGSIFLDEIGEVPVAIQIKLLRVLQERVFQPVGSHQQHRFAGRVIAATNQSIARLRAEGSFRDDFYYRLCSDTIAVPSLRMRLDEDPNELIRLCGAILARIMGEGDEEQAMRMASELAGCVPADYAWPGNVRELEQAVRSLLLTGQYQPVPAIRSDDDLPAWLRAAQSGQLSSSALLAAYCRHLYARHGQYGDVARVTGLDWRTVKKHLS
jgi:DNA-binding NtrC family response regulator